MIHIVFQEADVNVLEQAIALDPALSGAVMLVADDLAVGPLDNIFEEEGQTARRDWWRQVLDGGDYHGKADDGSVNDPAVVDELVKQLSADENEVVRIWAA